MPKNSRLTHPARTLLVAILALSVAGLVPARATQATASLSGVVRSAVGDAPLAGARVFAGDPLTGQVFPSEPSAEDGSFSIRELPAAVYEIAVESNSGLFLVEQKVPLLPGMDQALGIEVDPALAGSGGGGSTGGNRRPGVWNNPLTAALLVLGLAVLFGIVIDNATNDNDKSVEEKPSSPANQ